MLQRRTIRKIIIGGSSAIVAAAALVSVELLAALSPVTPAKVAERCGENMRKAKTYSYEQTTVRTEETALGERGTRTELRASCDAKGNMKAEVVTRTGGEGEYAFSMEMYVRRQKGGDLTYFRDSVTNEWHVTPGSRTPGGFGPLAESIAGSFDAGKAAMADTGKAWMVTMPLESFLTDEARESLDNGTRNMLIARGDVLGKARAVITYKKTKLLPKKVRITGLQYEENGTRYSATIEQKYGGWGEVDENSLAPPEYVTKSAYSMSFAELADEVTGGL